MVDIEKMVIEFRRHHFSTQADLKKIIFLAAAIGTDEDALICDLAETYGIYNYRQLPADRVAVFVLWA